MSYSLTSNFVPVEWFLVELWPLNLYFLFKCLVVRTFFLPPMRYWLDIWYVAISRWGTMYSLSLKFVLVEWFLAELWSLNLYFLFKLLGVRTLFWRPMRYYMLFSYQIGYIMWHSRLRMYIPFGAEGNKHPKPGMSHYIPCLIAE
jgi:hypothetical protein